MSSSDRGPGRTAVEIAAGFHFTCARLDDGQVKCWGLNRSGQLGLGVTSPRLRPTAPVALGDGRRAVEIAAGFAFACARLDDGTVKCWGENDGRQLGILDPLSRGARADGLGDDLPAVPIGD